MMRSTWLWIVLLFLAVPACKDSSNKEKESASAEPGQSAPTKEEAGTPEAPTPDRPKARNTVAPVAMDLGRSSHSLAAGLLIRPAHPSAEGRLCVAFLAPAGARVKSAGVWLGGEGEEKWIRVSLRSGTFRDVMLGVLPAGTEHPAYDLATAGPIPDTLTSMLTPEWGDPLNPEPVEPPKADPEREKLEREVQERYRALKEEEGELRQPPRPDRALSSAERMQIERKRRTRSSEIGREISEVEREARTLGIPLTSRSRSILQLPERAARIVSTAVEATRGGESEETPGLITIAAEPPVKNGILPGAFLARAGTNGLEVLGLQQLAEWCEARLGSLTGHVRLPRPTSPSLHLRLSLEPSAFGYITLRAGAAPHGELPPDLAEAPVTRTGSLSSSRAWIEVTLELEKLSIAPGDSIDAAVEIQHPGVAEWIRLAPVQLSWESHPTSVIHPVLTDSPAIRWTAPEPSEGSTEAQVPVATVTTRIEANGLRRAIQAGGGYYLLVHLEEPSRLRLLDLRSEKWIGELALPEGELNAVFGADAERAFVVDRIRGTLNSYSLPGFNPLQSIQLPNGPPPLLIAAGSNSHLMPLVLLFDRRIELRDPRTLEPGQEVIQYQNSNRQEEVGFSSAKWSAKGELTASELRSAPDGDHFVLAQTYQEKDRRPYDMALELKVRGTDWTLRPGANGAIGRNGLVYHSGHIYLNGSSYRVRHEFKGNPRFLLPATGAGIVAVAPSQLLSSFPPPPLRLAYHTGIAEPEPVLHSRAAAAAGEALLSQGASETDLAGVLHVLPALGKVVSLNPEEIVFERFAGVEADRPPPLVGVIPPATRGEKWVYSAADGNGNPLPLKLIKGPDGASVEDPGVLTWEVPLNFSLTEATFEIELGDPPLAQSLTAAVHGIAGANLRPAGGNASTPVPVSKAISFPDGIDQILPAMSGTIAAVISGGSRRATIIDLAKHEIIASYTCSSGIAAFGLGHRHLFAWHLDGDILETRELPGLAPAAIQPMGTTSRLVAFIVGSAPNALSPLALFTTERNLTEARSIAPDTLELSAAVPVSQNIYEQSDPPQGMAVHTPPASGDGGAFYYARRVLIRDSSGEFEVAEIPPTNLRDIPSHFSVDGSSFFQGDTATDLATRRSWSTKFGAIDIGSNFKSLLWPDLNQATVLAVTKYQPDNSNSQAQNYRIHFLDATTQELRFELDQLFEWDQSNVPLFAGKLANSRLLFDSRSGTLLTISSDGMRLIARKISFDLPK